MDKECRKDIDSYAFAVNTQKATSTGMKNWRLFCAEYGLKEKLGFVDEGERNRSTRQLANFLHHEASRVSKKTHKRKLNSYASFSAYYNDVKRYHLMNGIRWKPTYLIRLKMKSLRRQYARGVNRKMPLLTTMVDRFKRRRLLDVLYNRDDELIAMIMLLSIYGLFRISELLNEPTFWVEEVKEKRQLHVKLTDSKTLWRNDGLPEIVVVSEVERAGPGVWCPVNLVLQRTFRQKKEERQMRIPIMMENGKRLTRRIYSQKLKVLLSKIGIDPKKYDTHSGRIGGATMMWEAGYSDAQIKRFGRWRSDSWTIYCRTLKSKFIDLASTLKNSGVREDDIVFNTDELIVKMGGEKR